MYISSSVWGTAIMNRWWMAAIAAVVAFQQQAFFFRVTGENVLA
jgi:hypothetical protein